MKAILSLFAMMFLVGCGNNSMNQSGSTNSASGEPPANYAATNAPAITNNTDVNQSAPTNQ
jgi:hypothetical protein